MKTLSLRVAALAALLSVAAAAQTAAPPDRFFDSNGVQIRYVEQGSGTPVQERQAARSERLRRRARQGRDPAAADKKFTEDSIKELESSRATRRSRPRDFR